MNKPLWWVYTVSAGLCLGAGGIAFQSVPSDVARLVVAITFAALFVYMNNCAEQVSNRARIDQEIHNPTKAAQRD